MANRRKSSRTQIDKQIRAVQSLCKLKRGDKSVVLEHLEERRAEREKENREFIHSLRGSIKFDTGGKPFAEWMAELNREEKELEEKRFRRLPVLGGKNR